MSKNKTVGLSDTLYEYLLAQSLREPALLAELREETATEPLAGMQITPEQGQFLALLVTLTGARNILEVGVFTGYSSLAMALAQPPDGRLIACDIDAHWTGIARRYWERAGVSGRIELRLAPAIETLDALLASGEANRFDLAFIDADKTGYDGYYERCLKLVRPGGLILIDNVLWGGRVADPTVTDPDTAAIRALNAKIRKDPRVINSLVPIADGLTLALKNA
ncbi:MAG: SAM-dependent methyltransferase [Gammaproteobacteria bacterium]|nr:SAM-dependent methyltransferase [Gammaproteobacteria bacterium]